MACLVAVCHYVATGSDLAVRTLYSDRGGSHTDRQLLNDSQIRVTE